MHQRSEAERSSAGAGARDGSAKITAAHQEQITARRLRSISEAKRSAAAQGLGQIAASLRPV